MVQNENCCIFVRHNTSVFVYLSIPFKCGCRMCKLGINTHIKAYVTLVNKMTRHVVLRGNQCKYKINDSFKMSIHIYIYIKR